MSHQVELVFGESPLFVKAMESVDLFARSHWPLLITGPAGVGKELIARRVHRLSDRKNGPFIPVNCGALPPGLFESELFGYERGAFSGAIQNTRGLVRAAQGGTLFLDEIGDLDLGLQVKILRLLESNEIRSVGANRVEYVDVRIVAATNRDLSEAVDCGNFRQDLLERLGVLLVELPPLKDRLEDIPLIAAHILERMGTQMENLDLKCLLNFDWPGNVRQLRNLLIRADVLGKKKVNSSLLEHLVKLEQLRTRKSRPIEIENLGGSTLADIEKQVIVEKLKRCRGNRKMAAKELGIAKSTLHEKLRKWKNLGEEDSFTPAHSLSI